MSCSSRPFCCAPRRRPTCPSSSCWTASAAVLPRRASRDRRADLQLELPAHALHGHIWQLEPGTRPSPPSHRPSKEKKIVARRDSWAGPSVPNSRSAQYTEDIRSRMLQGLLLPYGGKIQLESDLEAERDKCFSMSIPCSAEIANVDWPGHLSLVSNGSGHRDGSSKPSHKPTFGQEEQNRQDKAAGARAEAKPVLFGDSICSHLAACSVHQPRHHRHQCAAPEWVPRANCARVWVPRHLYCRSRWRVACMGTTAVPSRPSKPSRRESSSGGRTVRRPTTGSSPRATTTAGPSSHPHMEPRLRRRRPLQRFIPEGKGKKGGKKNEAAKQPHEPSLSQSPPTAPPKPQAEGVEPSGEGGVPSCSGLDGRASKKTRSAGSAKERGGDKPRKEDKDAPAAAAAGSCEQAAAAAAASSSWLKDAKPPSVSLPAEYHPSEPLAVCVGQGSNKDAANEATKAPTRARTGGAVRMLDPLLLSKCAREEDDDGSPRRRFDVTVTSSHHLSRENQLGVVWQEDQLKQDVLVRGHRSPKILHKIRPRSDTIASLKVALYSLLKQGDKYRAVQAADQKFLRTLTHKKQEKAAQQQEQILIQEGKEVAEGAVAPAPPSSGMEEQPLSAQVQVEQPREELPKQLPIPHWTHSKKTLSRSSCPSVSPREVPREASIIQLPPAQQQQSSEASAPLPRASSLRGGG
ncbi:unnamed protein product [Vitrella brassicaformis CCMP3155]|uniref:Uncharacterized protein n=1 Tax=Vitrella brassicaformis (strain CCMP3155) TaxID=1169540 RepID=A0A0G4EIJ5_VITBC|nr:unnamed protein product [Vitrella brassicaformis CCMP3155]|eukprot:CEL95806.1 unnamed protein product [Vitrella brassicaformis CCMP3155]